MNFNLKETAVFQAYKRSKFFIFRYAYFLNQLFLFVFIFSLFFVFVSLLNKTSEIFAIKISVLFLLLSITFWNIYLFTKLKLKKINLSIKLSDAVLNPDDYNLADFLSLELVDIVKDSIKFCHKKNIFINSASLLYSSVKLSK
jgi:hypothetical protein